MKTHQPEENHGSAAVSVFRLAPGKLLPAICPACGALGTRPQSLKVSGAPFTSAELDAHYCDICADDRNAKTTRHLAWLGACTLLVLAGTTAAALALGTRELVFQVAVPLALGGLTPAALRRAKLWNEPKDPLELQTDPSGVILLTRSRQFRRSLREHGFQELEGRDPVLVPFLTKHQTPLALAVIGLCWLSLLHSLGGAEVRVFVSGRENAVLLVDTRHFGKISPTNAEDPRAGGSVRVLGGRRHLELISESGVLLGGATKTIWPGRTYIVGQLPPSECLFWEWREYGEGAQPSILFPVGGEGPVWELREQVDSWFVPLESPFTEQESETVDWQTRGGVRRAIRLLPCRGRSATHAGRQ